MNLSINNSINNQPNFQARIKIGKPSLKAIAQSAIGTSAFATGSIAVGAGILSFDALGDTGSIAHALPIDKELADGLHKGLHKSLYSAGTRYDAAGETGGIPVQSTIAPTAFIASGVESFNRAEIASVNASKIGMSDISVTKPIEALKTLAANKLAQKSALGAAYTGIAAASIYSGLHPEVLPQSVQGLAGSPEDYADENGYVDPYYYDSRSYQGDSANSLMSSGISELASPVISVSTYGLSKASDTKSSQFVKETITEPNSNKKLPS